MRKRLCKATKRSKTLAVIRRHTKKASSLHSNIWPCSSFGAAGMGIAPSTMQGIRSRAADAVCPKSGRCVHVQYCHWFAPTLRAPPCWAGLRASSSGQCFGKALMNMSTRAQSLQGQRRAAPRRDFLLDEGSGSLDGGHVCLFLSTQRGGEGVYWSFYGCG